MFSLGLTNVIDNVAYTIVCGSVSIDYAYNALIKLKKFHTWVVVFGSPDSSRGGYRKCYRMYERDGGS